MDYASYGCIDASTVDFTSIEVNVIKADIPSIGLYTLGDSLVCDRDVSVQLLTPVKTGNTLTWFVNNVVTTYIVNFTLLDATSTLNSTKLLKSF